MIYVEKEKEKKVLSEIRNKVVKEWVQHTDCCAANRINENEKIIIPYNVNKYMEKGKRRKIEKIAKKLISEIDNNKNVVVENQLKENKELLNYIYSQNINIIDGNIMYQVLLEKIVVYILEKRELNMNDINITFLINKSNKYLEASIIKLAKRVKRINIITNNRHKFEKIEEKVMSETGIVLNISANTKKAITKSKLVINYDFTQEAINKCNIADEAIVINILYNTIILKKKYNGININDFKIEEIKKIIDDEQKNKYDMKDIYEAMILEKKINTEYALNNIKIEKVYINNGVI